MRQNTPRRCSHFDTFHPLMCRPSVQLSEEELTSPGAMSSITLMASFYGWAQDRAEGMLMILVDDGTEYMPPSHSGRAFPGNRSGTLARRDFTLQPTTAAEVHVAVDADLTTARRATVIVRGRIAPESDNTWQRVPEYRGLETIGPLWGGLPGGAGGLVFGSAGLRVVPNAFHDALSGAEVVTKP